MSAYKCINCDYMTNRKDNYIKHINRLKSCKRENLRCEFCGVSFEYKSKFIMHKRRKTKCIDDEEEYRRIEHEIKIRELEEIRELFQEKLKEVGYSSDNTTNNNTTNINKNQTNNQTNNQNSHNQNSHNTINNNINININKFGNEDVSYITSQYLASVVKKGIINMADLAAHIHFNTEHPENHTLFYPSHKSDYMFVSDGTNFNMVPVNDVTDQVYYNCGNLLESFLDSRKAKKLCSESDLQRFDNGISDVIYEETENGKVAFKGMKDKLRLKAYNSRVLVKPTYDKVCNQYKENVTARCEELTEV